MVQHGHCCNHYTQKNSQARRPRCDGVRKPMHTTLSAHTLFPNKALLHLLLGTTFDDPSQFNDTNGIPWLLPFCAAKLGGLSVSVIMVADPGAFSGSPEAMHYLSNLQHAKNAPQGSTVCAQRTTGTYVRGWVCKQTVEALFLTSSPIHILYIDKNTHNHHPIQQQL